MNRNCFKKNINYFEIKHPSNKALSVYLIDVDFFDVNFLLVKSELDGEEQVFFETLRMAFRKKEWLGARALLNLLFNEKVYIDYLNDKPYLVNRKEFVSISHSRNWVAVSVSDKNTSVDIEIEREDKLNRIKNKFTNEAEQDSILLENKLLLSWCAKECVYKYYNKKGLSFLNDIGLQSIGDDLVSEVKIEEKMNVLKLNWVKLKDVTVVYA